MKRILFLVLVLFLVWVNAQTALAQEFIYLPLIVGAGGEPPPTASDVKLVQIVYNPDGDDVAGEYVEIRNDGSAQDMSGWSLADEAGAKYNFPAGYNLQASASVKVWTKAGTNTTTDLYWGNNRAIWNNDGDTADLKDDADALIDSCTYTGGGVAATCTP